MKSWEVTALMQAYISGEIPELMLPTAAQVGILEQSDMLSQRMGFNPVWPGCLSLSIRRS